MIYIDTEDPRVVAVIEAIHTGNIPELKRLLEKHPELIHARLGDDDCGMSRTLLHIATDWPGHFPNGVATVAVLVQAGADVNARFTGPHTETPLHWAASSDDVEVLDALLDAGADIEATGAVIGGGTPLADARAFGQWKAAHRLVARGAQTMFHDAATLGLMERVEAYFTPTSEPTAEEINRAFWGACHGGQRHVAEYLLAKGADLNWIPDWENLTPLDAAQREENDLVDWLRNLGAKSANHTIPVLTSILTCPACGFQEELTMPTDACQFFHICTNCKTRLKAKEGDCCVFCSYGSVPCPPMQLEKKC